MENFKQAFYEEASELLEQLEGRLLEMEQNPTDVETISAVFRIMHTIKGAAAMFGFTAISKFTHEIESAMESIRDGRVMVQSDLVTITLRGRDHITLMLENDDLSPQMVADGDEILNLFRDYVTKFAVGGSSASTDSQVSPDNSAKEEVSMIIDDDDSDESSGEFKHKMDIIFEPTPDIFLNGTNPLSLIDEIREMGNHQVELNIDKLPDLSSYDIEKCYLSWHITLLTNKCEADIKEVFIFLDETSKIIIKEEKFRDESIISLSEIGIDEDSTPTIKDVSATVTTSAQASVASKEKSSDGGGSSQAKLKDLSSQTIRVASDKLDSLFDLVGELVTFNARLSQTSVAMNNSNLIALAEQSERLISEIRSISMSMRMLPIGSTFSKFQRLVRDLSSQLGKSVEMETEGADTELDKTVIDKLSDPLVHMIRNSLDHGIELPDIREAAGKSRTGTVKLSAEHKGSFVNIVISDDGAGISKARVLKKAIDNGILKEEQVSHLNDSEIYDLVFAPGFSTAEAVTDLSGRGVGMDVVKKEIAALGGSVLIQSEEGKGSKFILKLPLTLAIIEGLLIRVGSNFYILPLVSVEECSMFNSNDVKEEGGISFLSWRDKIVPFVNLKEYFNGSNTNTKDEQIVIVRDRDNYIGFIVDKVIGNMQTVIKPLGKLFRNVDMVSGATIMGDGTLALILDLYKLAENLSKEGRAR